MKTRALAPWFGSNRTLAHHVGAHLDGCEWVGVPFAGGMSELAHIAARTVVVNDLHRGVINLARVVADPMLAPRLIRGLRRVPFHPDSLADAQERFNICGALGAPDLPDFTAARDYFLCAWMTRNGTAGTDAETTAALSVRWDAGGGDSVVRFRSAVESLREWRGILARCSFSTLDVFAFLDKVKDRPTHGIYLDPPFPGPGDAYRHKLTEAHQHQLAARLGSLAHCRVVARFYDHPLIRHLYPEPFWVWHHLAGGRTQANNAAPEVLLIRNHPDQPCSTCNGSGMPGGVSGFGACPGCDPAAAPSLPPGPPSTPTPTADRYANL